jgi:hypothetical protein
MSIPLDKLYHYIESIARDVCKDNIVIYRFFPHGSKKLDDLKISRKAKWQDRKSVEIYAYDQEPLSFKLYDYAYASTESRDFFKKANVPVKNRNLRIGGGIYDLTILLHSEVNSVEVEIYKQNKFVPAYYWSHGVIARDWFRYAEYEVVSKDIKKTFLIYNRAWTGTREYRLKFTDLLIEHKLTNQCKSFFNPIDPQDKIYYNDHEYKNINLKPHNNLENYFEKTQASSSSSADYELLDYESTDIEIVLETLFDDQRIQLTEKILRPIALGQPFILASTKGSLDYLKSYGFKTFSEVFDESYDLIEDPVARLKSIIKTMKDISNWSDSQRIEKIKLANDIASYNRKLFFSDSFVNQIVSELKVNLLNAYAEIKNINTSAEYLARRKELGKYEGMRSYLLDKCTRKEQAEILKQARLYYMRTLPE